MDAEPLREVTGTSDEALMPQDIQCSCVGRPQGMTPCPMRTQKEPQMNWAALSQSAPHLNSKSTDDPGHLACHSRSCLPAFSITRCSKQTDPSIPAQHCNPTLCNGYSRTQPPPMSYRIQETPHPSDPRAPHSLMKRGTGLVS